MRILTINNPVSEEEFTSKTEEEVLEITYKKCIDNYKTKSKNIKLKLFCSNKGRI